MQIEFRPHHFLCALCFKGKGYSASFIRNFAEIIQHLTTASAGEQTSIMVSGYTDSVCAPCPHKRGKACQAQAKVSQLDKAHAKALGLQIGEKLTWQAAKQRITERIDLAKFNQICQPCEWKSLGICEAALEAFLTAKD